MKNDDLVTQPIWYWVLLIGVIAGGLIGFALFLLNRATPVPASWAAAGGPRDGWGSFFNALISSVLLPLLAVVFGGLILRRQPRHPVGRLLLAIGTFSMAMYLIGEWAVYAYYTVGAALPGSALAAWTTNWNWAILMTLVVWLLALFPNGALLSGRWRFLIIACTAVFLLATVTAAGIETPMTSAYQIPNPYVEQHRATLYDALFAVTIPALIAAAIVVVLQTVARFRRSRGVERAQLKWLLAGVAGFAALILVGLMFFLLGQAESSDDMGGLSELGAIMVNSAVLAPLVCVGIAMVRHQLYDIDVIIRRTTSYAVVTGLLVLVYFGTVVLLQRLFTSVTGQSSTVAVVLSTLLIAALFLPVRRRVQDVIDRRFFRQKYDAEQVLTQFAATVRDETDLESLTAELERVIQETMQPEFVTVWLAPEAQPAPGKKASPNAPTPDYNPT